MAHIEKRYRINSNKLSGEYYFTSILQEAYADGLLSRHDMENIQLQCMKLLTQKCAKYAGYDSSSLRVETAENIMKSNLYTVGLYLKSLPDTDSAVDKLKTTPILHMYQKGRAIIDDKWSNAKVLYARVKANKINTSNYTYNATLSESGIGSFFRQYDADYAAHDIPASIDYQLCHPVTELTGIVYIEKYLEQLLQENEFCQCFQAEAIHHLLYGFDEGYEDLLINIFEQVITQALGCLMAQRNIRDLELTGAEIGYLKNVLAQEDEQWIAMKIRQAALQVLQELQLASLPQRSYLETCLPRITLNIVRGLRGNTLDKVFITPVNPELKPKTLFLPGEKMSNKNYRRLIEELLMCRHSSDKLALIKEKVKSFADIEDVLLDAMLSETEVFSVLHLLDNTEIAALLQRHPYRDTEDLSESEGVFRVCLKDYINKLPSDRKDQIYKMMNHLVTED